MRYTFSFLFGCLSLALSAQSTLQYRFDTTTTDLGDVLVSGTVTPDGAHWAILRSSSGPVVQKGSADGTPQWARGLSQGNERGVLVPLSDNGCLLVVPFGSDLQNMEVYDDTITIHLGITRFQADGSIIWQRGLSATALYPGDWGEAYVAGILGVADGSGALILANISWGIAASHQYIPCVFRITDTGDLLWTKAYGFSEAPWIDQWGGVSDLMTASDGTSYLFTPGNGALPGPMLVHFDADGNIIWAKHATYENAPDWELNSAAMNNDDEPILVGRSSGFNGLRIHLDANGAFEDANVYTGIEGGHGVTRLTNDADMDVLIANGHQFVRVDHVGDVIAAASITGTSFQSHTITFVPVSNISVNGKLIAMGNMHIVDDVFGYQVHEPEVWSLPIPVPDGCLIAADKVTGYQVPDTLITLTDDPMEISMTLPGTSEAANFYYPMLDPFGVLAVCDQFNGVPSTSMDLDLKLLGMYDAETGSILVSISKDAEVTMVAANGAVLLDGFHVRTGERTRLPVDRPAPGLYALRARTSGRSLEATRAVIVLP